MRLGEGDCGLPEALLLEEDIGVASCAAAQQSLSIGLERPLVHGCIVNTRQTSGCSGRGALALHPKNQETMAGWS